MVACGTAFYACLTAKYWIEQLVRIPVEIDIASELRYREPPVPAGTAALFVSQSGETADTLGRPTVYERPKRPYYVGGECAHQLHRAGK